MASNMTPTGDRSSPDGLRIDEQSTTSNIVNDCQTPNRKTAGESLKEFVLTLDEYVPTLPDPVVSYYLQSAGFDTTDPRIIRLISIAAQKFISDIANDALQHCKMRGAGQSKKTKNDKRYVLTVEDLTPALLNMGSMSRNLFIFLSFVFKLLVNSFM